MLVGDIAGGVTGLFIPMPIAAPIPVIGCGGPGGSAAGGCGAIAPSLHALASASSARVNRLRFDRSMEFRTLITDTFISRWTNRSTSLRVRRTHAARPCARGRSLYTDRPSSLGRQLAFAVFDPRFGRLRGSTCPSQYTWNLS